MKSAAVIAIAIAAACGRAEAPAPARKDPPGTCAGRTIAPTMSFVGAAWLDRGERETRERPEVVLDALAIADGMIVADVGAGSGYFTLRIARRVPRGKVIATDVQPEMLAMIRERAASSGLANIETRLVKPDDAGLAPASIDLALLVDVYHELSDPAAVVGGIRRALRPGGRLVLVEYRAEDPSVPIKPEHEMSLAQIRRELVPMGFREVADLEMLPDQRVVVFTPDDRSAD